MKNHRENINAKKWEKPMIPTLWQTWKGQIGKAQNIFRAVKILHSLYICQNSQNAVHQSEPKCNPVDFE